MRKNDLRFDDFTDYLAGLRNNCSDNGYDHDNTLEHRRMLRALTKAIDGELTERQRDCLHLCYFEGKSVSEAARELHIGIPTASKHLKKARQRLCNILRYSFSRLE